MSEFYRADIEPVEPYKMSPAEEALRDYLMEHLDRLFTQRSTIYRAGYEPTWIAIPLMRSILALVGATFLGLPLMVSADVAEPMMRSKRGYLPSRADLDAGTDLS